MSKAEATTTEEKTAFDARTEVVITLDFPFEFDGERIEKLTMRRSKMGDRIWASKQGGTDEEKTAKLMARLCDTKPEVIAKLDDVDADKVDRQYGAFRGQGVS